MGEKNSRKKKFVVATFYFVFILLCFLLAQATVSLSLRSKALKFVSIIESLDRDIY